MENIKEPILQIKDVCISYTSSTMAVKHVSADIQKNTITAIMGPSGCGKSTLLRAVNRMHELYKNIYDNVLAGYLLNGIRLSKSEKDEIVERNLRSVALWDEVKDSLTKRGTFLSGGQQQRLCIARSLALKPDVLLMDEPTSALDPIATKYIEELMDGLKKDVTILIVTHNMSQAMRISDYSMFMYMGELIEYDRTDKMFDNPTDERTRAYLTGKMG